MTPVRRPIGDITPSARRLVTSLRDVGYDFSTAIADIVDNSISAMASRIDIRVEFDGDRSWIWIADDGSGMAGREVDEAMRFGSRRDYGDSDLGKYGLGLKTASLSQCRRLSVVTRRSPERCVVAGRTLDLDHVEETDRWELVAPEGEVQALATGLLQEGPGTVVIWEDLDRVLAGVDAASGFGRRRLGNLADRAGTYLAMVFHRFLEDPADPVTITVNGSKLEPWNPFAPRETHTEALQVRAFELEAGNQVGIVTIRPYVLPPRHRFSSHEAFDSLSGPLKWNRQQGLYVYRGGRLIQSGGWAGMRSVDEHTKLARAAVEFSNNLDELFRVDVAKMRIQIPAVLKPMLERPVNELCARADSVYRSENSAEARSATTKPTVRSLDGVGVALRAAAMESGDFEALGRIARILRQRSPEAADALSL